MSKTSVKLSIIVLALFVAGLFQPMAAQQEKEIPVKMFSSALKHVPGLDKDVKTIITKVKKEFKLYYKEEKDRKYHRVALDVIDEDKDSRVDYLFVYFLRNDMYKTEVSRIILGDNYEFLLIEENYKPGEWETSAELEGTYAGECPDNTVEVLLSTCETGIPTAVAAINTSYDEAVSAGYTARKLMGSEENTTAIDNWLTCPNLIYWGRVGHGYTGGVVLDDANYTSTDFNNLEPNALQGKVLYFNSCEVFNDPLKSSILNKGALKFIGGICNLYIGSSEEVFMCWNDKNFYQVPPPVSVSDEMCYWSAECESSTGYPQPGCHGCGGPGSVFPEPAAGSYYTLTVNITGQGSVTLNPPGGVYTDGEVVTLTANPATNWSFDSWSGDLTGSQNPITITMNANKNVTALFTSDLPGSLTVLSPNGGETWKRRSTQAIQWTSTGDITSVAIYYYYNGSWNTITSSTANDGSYSWQLPNLRNVQSLIKIVSGDGTVEDQSDAYFTVIK